MALSSELEPAPPKRPVRRFRALASGATAVGATALGALAVGAVSIGAVTIGALAIGRVRIRKLRIDELEVGKITQGAARGSLATTSLAPEGLVQVVSRHGPDETIARLRTAVAAHGMTVMGAVDHSAAAREAGLTLVPTTLLIFGNARAGTPLMERSETVGLDLPLRVLVRATADGKTALLYTDPVVTGERHGLSDAPQLAAMASALATVTAEAAN